MSVWIAFDTVRARQTGHPYATSREAQVDWPPPQYQVVTVTDLTCLARADCTNTATTVLQLAGHQSVIHHVPACANKKCVENRGLGRPAFDPSGRLRALLS